MPLICFAISVCKKKETANPPVAAQPTEQLEQEVEFAGEMSYKDSKVVFCFKKRWNL